MNPMTIQPKVSSSGLVAYAIIHHVMLALVYLFGFIALVSFASQEDGIGAFTVFISIICYIVTVVFSLMILHRGWASVQDGAARTTPGKAVGFLFIPIYFLYWTFVAWPGLMSEFSRLAEARGKGRDSVNGGLAIAYAILRIIPYLNYLIAPLFQVAVLWQIIGAVKEQEQLA